MRILRMTMSHSQIQKKNNFQPEDQISTVYKNSSFQPEHYFLGRGFFMLIIIVFNQLLRYRIFPIRQFSTTYCDQTNIKKGIRISSFNHLFRIPFFSQNRVAHYGKLWYSWNRNYCLLVKIWLTQKEWFWNTWIN